MISTLPSIIAKTYASSKRDPRMTKDYQYFTVEYSLGTLCALGYAVLEQHSDGGVTSQNTDYSKMSMGLWLSLLRNLCSEMAQLSSTDPLVSIFTSMGSSDLFDSIGAFVTKRNHDMHGNPIGQSAIEKELAAREQLIQPLLQVWQQFVDWRFVTFDNIVFEDGRIVYIGMEHHGENASAIELYSRKQSDSTGGASTVKKHSLYFVNLNDMKQRYSVSPLLIWDFQSSTPRMALFSKSMTKGTEHLEFNSTSGPVRLVLDDLGETPLHRLRTSFYTFLYRYNPSKQRAPEVDARWILSRRNGVVEEDAFVVSLEIANQSNDCSLFDLQVHQIFGADVSVKLIQPTGVLVTGAEQQGQSVVDIQVERLESNETLCVEVYELRFSEQGHYQLPQAELNYKYTRINQEKDQHQRDGVEIVGDDFEVVDPNSATPFRPILNSNLWIRNNDNIEIGDHFELVLEIENIGFAMANEVDLELVLPDALTIIQGQKILLTSIPPRETKTVTLTLSSWNAGVYTVFLRDVSYSGIYGKRYVSSATRGLYVLIQSNKRKALEYSMIQAYEDLYLEEQEENHLKELFNKTPNVDLELYHRMERNIRRSRILSIFEQKFEGVEIEPEEIGVKGQRDLLYSIHGVPLFGMRLEDNAEEVKDVQCFGLRTFLRKDALHKESIANHSVFIQEWISYEEIAKDQAYRQNFFYTWFAGIKKSMDQILMGRQVMHHLMHQVGGEQIQFTRDSFSMVFESSKAQCVGFTANDICYLRVEHSNYAKQHVIIRLPNTNLVLSEQHIANEYQYYTNGLEEATRRTSSIGFSFVWKKNMMGRILERCLELWNIAMEEWSRHLCSVDALGGARVYITTITDALRPCISTGLRLLRHADGLVWLKSESTDSCVSPSSDKGWGYLRFTGKSTIYIGIRCKEETTIHSDLLEFFSFVVRDGYVVCEWKVNGQAELLPHLVELLRQQHRTSGRYMLPEILFDQWMQYVTYHYGYVVYELLQLLQQEDIPVSSLQTVLKLSGFRVNRFIREMTSEFEERIVECTSQHLALNPVYVPLIEQWLETQIDVQKTIWTTLDVCKQRLEECFPKQDGWIVEIPKTLRIWTMIEVYKPEWCYGLSAERRMSIAIFVERSYFNRIQSVGIFGRFENREHRFVRDELHQIVAAYDTFSSNEVKVSEWWPAYLGLKYIPAELQDTGGSNWKYQTLESQNEIAAHICRLMMPFKVFEQDIFNTVGKHHALLEDEWSKQYEQLYGEHQYRNLIVTETKLALPRLTLARELFAFTQRLLEEDWQSVNARLSWSHELGITHADSKSNVLSKWGRKGIRLGTPSWKPGIFIGTMIDGNDHREPVISSDGGADLTVIVSVHRSAGAEGVSGDEMLYRPEWTEMIERLLSTETDFAVIDHLQRPKANRWHPLHLRIPLHQIWDGCVGSEERYQRYLLWIQNGVRLIMSGGELESLIAFYDD